MQSRNIITAVAVILLLNLAAACSKTENASAPAASANIDPAKLELFKPLPEVVEAKNNPVTEEKITLGRMLFFETRLSKSQQISCNSCHFLTQYGTDGEVTSDGHKGQKGDRNAPSVYNAAGHFTQFWDGRAADVEEQAKGPVMNPVEMAMPAEQQVIATLNSMPEYREAFKKAFPEDKDPVTFDNMAKAIGAFERRLVTPSRWDRFLRGDQAALTNEEKAGFNTYMNSGCPTCHSGTYVGGNQYQRLGAAKPWPDTKDPGRMKVTNSEADKMVFKVPSLRNIEKTGPYYHDGKIASLEEAITKMSEHQVGKKLSDAEVKSIVAWLKALTGDVPAEYIQEPKLPPSSSTTPKPDATN